MNKAFLLSLVRHAITGAGSAVVTKGLATSSDIEAIAGGAAVLVGLLWSWFEKRAAAQPAKPATGPNGTAILTLLLLGVFTIPAGMFTTGCASRPGTPGGSFDPVPLVQSAAYVGSFIYLSDHPEKRPVFEKTYQALESLADRDTVGVMDLQQAFDPLLQHSIRELRDGERRLIVTTSVAVVQGYVGSLDLTKSENAGRIRDVVRAARDGLRAALVNTAPPPSGPPPAGPQPLPGQYPAPAPGQDSVIIAPPRP